MNEKKGILELLCGPSGVGKTSSLEGVKRSYRIIDEASRPIRLGECVDLEGCGVELDKIKQIIYEQGAFMSQFGIFVSAQEFKRRIKEEFFVWYETEDGRRYGFGKELKLALENGAHCSEQITTFEAIELVDKELSKFTQVIKKVFLVSFDQIKRRLCHRSKTKKEYQARLENIENLLKKYLDNISLFDEMNYNFPELLSTNEAVSVLNNWKQNLKKNKGFVLEYSISPDWNSSIFHSVRTYLDVLILFNIVEDLLNSKAVAEIVDPVLQFNNYNDDLQTTLDYILHAKNDELLSFYDGFTKFLKENNINKIKFLQYIDEILENPIIKLFHTYSNSQYSDQEALVYLSWMLQIQNNPELAVIYAIIKLHKDIYQGDFDLYDFITKIKRSSEALKKGDNVASFNFLQKIIDDSVRLILNKKQETYQDFLKKEIPNQRIVDTEIELDPYGADEKYFNEFIPSIIIRKLKDGIDIINLGVNFFTDLDDVSELTFFTLRFYIRIEEQILQDIKEVIDQKGLAYKKSYTQFGQKLRAIAESQIQKDLKMFEFIELFQEYQDKLNELKYRQEVNERGVLYVNTDSLEYDVKKLIVEVNKGLSEYELDFENIRYNYLISISPFSMLINLIIHEYCLFYYNDEFVDLIESTLIYKVKSFLDRMVINTGFNKALNYFMFLNCQMFETLMRIMKADRDKPNSVDNLWSFPVFPDQPQIFFQEYFITDIPEVKISYEKINKIIKDMIMIRELREK